MTKKLIERVIGKQPQMAPSRLTPSQIQNYLLCLSLMKTIILRFITPTRSKLVNRQYEIEVGQQLEWLKSIELYLDQRQPTKLATQRSTRSKSKSPRVTTLG